MHFWVPGISGPARLKTKLGQKAQEAIARYVPREASFMLAVQSIYQSHQDISRWFIIYIIILYILYIYIYTYNYIYIYIRIVYIRYTMIYIIIKIEVSCPVFGICVAILSKQRVGAHRSVVDFSSWQGLAVRPKSRESLLLSPRECWGMCPLDPLGALVKKKRIPYMV